MTAIPITGPAMTGTQGGRAPITLAPGQPMLDLVVPVYNEERDLEPCVRSLYDYLASTFPYPFRITIANNASTDSTLAVAMALAAELPGVAVRHLERKGRGLALRTAWSDSDAAVLGYLDVDLSTDLAAILPLVAPLISGHSDLAIGSRLARGSRVVRGPKREFISRCYNVMLKGALAARFSDAQCGFKAIRSDVAGQLLPLVKDTGWFFDTELLVLAQRASLRIHEVPVDWIDDPDSRVDIVATAMADIKGISRLAKGLLIGTIPVGDLRRELGREPLRGVGMAATPGLAAAGATAAAPVAAPAGTPVPAGLVRQLASFCTVGVVSTLAYLLLYALLREPAGAQLANFVALLLTAIANTAANRRLTFGVTGAAGVMRHQFQGLLVFGLGLGLTSGSLALLTMVAPHAPRLVELTVLILANLMATLLRFLFLRIWVFAANREDRRP